MCEGEWCSDALAKAGTLVTTSGAGPRRQNRLATARRDVTIWPDNDEAGRCYADAVADALPAVDCTVRMIDVAKLGLLKKGDAVDWLKANPAATAADIAALPCVEADGAVRADEATLEEAPARISEVIEQVKAGDYGAPFDPDIVEAMRAASPRIAASISVISRRGRLLNFTHLLR